MRVLVVAAVAVLLALPVPAAGQEQTRDWTELLQRAAHAPQEQTYSGEVVQIVWDGGRAHADVLKVRNSRRRGLTLTTPMQTLEFGDGTRGITDHAGGWYVTMPEDAAAQPGKTVVEFSEKYRVTGGETEQVAGRQAVRLDVHRRSDGLLRDRLWIDEESGLIVRRETFGRDGRRVRLSAYLSLDLRPGRRVMRADRDRAVPLRSREQALVPVGQRGLTALRDAGWVVPAELPGGYRVLRVFALSGEGSQPLQVLYGDGMYHVSLFQQPGRPDWSTLPEGAQIDDEHGRAYEWPGALPQRRVWEADGRTFSLVGDAPPDEFNAIAAALPAPDPPGLRARLRAGVGRVVSWLSPWH